MPSSLLNISNKASGCVHKITFRHNKTISLVFTSPKHITTHHMVLSNTLYHCQRVRTFTQNLPMSCKHNKFSATTITKHYCVTYPAVSNKNTKQYSRLLLATLLPKRTKWRAVRMFASSFKDCGKRKHRSHISWSCSNTNTHDNKLFRPIM